MNKIHNFVLSDSMAKLLIAIFTAIVAAGAILHLTDTHKISPTYAHKIQLSQADTTSQQLQRQQQAQNTQQAAADSLTLATSQETVISDTKEITIPCAWSDITITLSDFELMCRTVYCEAGNQPIETQIMAALTILNRLSSENYPDTVTEVIYQDSQYSVTEWPDFDQYGWTSSVEQAVTYALEVNEHPGDMYYFRTDHYHPFGQPYTVSGDLYFSTQQ